MYSGKEKDEICSFWKRLETVQEQKDLINYEELWRFVERLKKLRRILKISARKIQIKV